MSLPRLLVRPALRSARAFSSTPAFLSDKPAAVPIALISKIRSARPGTPLSLARSALQASSNDLTAALAWLTAQAAETGAAKAAKLSGREATQGLIGVALLADGLGGAGVRAAMVELSCETDFVARTDQFRGLTEAAARSLAYFAEPADELGKGALAKLEWDTIKGTPIVPSSAAETAVTAGEVPRADELPVETLNDAIAAMVSRLGENIHLRRAASVHLPPVPKRGVPLPLASTYLHGAPPPSPADGKAALSTDPTFSAGTLGSLLLWRLAPGGALPKPEVKAVLRSVARQAVAFPTTSVLALEGVEERAEGEPSTALYEQSLITMQPKEGDKWASGATVQEVLAAWGEARGLGNEGLVVEEIVRWEVGGEL